MSLARAQWTEQTARQLNNVMNVEQDKSIMDQAIGILCLNLAYLFKTLKVVKRARMHN